MKRKTATILKYHVLFTEEPEGVYSVSVPDLPGCHSQGETFEEAAEHSKEAIHLCLNVAKNDNDYASKIAVQQNKPVSKLKAYATTFLA